MGSNPTTGIGVAARVKITSSAPVLVLIGAEQLLTYQITAKVTDVDGTPLSSQPELYYNIVAGNDVAEVSDTGLVTATGAGQAVIQVSAAAFGNTINLFTVDGVPINAIYAEQTVQAVPGVPLQPDFSFTLDSDTYTVSSNGTFSITITQTALNGFTGDVSYALFTNYPLPRAGAVTPSQPLPVLSFRFYTPFGGIPVTIAGNTTGIIMGGSGSLTLSFTAQDAPAGVVPFVIAGIYPVWGATGTAAGGPVRSHNISSTLTVTA